MSNLAVRSHWTEEELVETGLNLVVPHIPEFVRRIEAQVNAMLRLRRTVDSVTLRLLGIHWDATKLVAGTPYANEFLCDMLQEKCALKPTRVKLYHDQGYVFLTSYFDPPLVN